MDARLDKADWLKQGLRTLADDGVGGLKVGAMAAKLAVSRGSFYWHFKDVADFHAQLLHHWQERTTDRVVREMAGAGGAPERLRQLLRRAFTLDRGLEQGIRAWAGSDAKVAARMAGIDAARIAYIARLLRDAGVAEAKARHRAAFIYWAYLGQAIAAEQGHGSIDEAAIDDISGLFET